MFERIIEGRGTGKTKKIMLMAKENNGILVCHNPSAMRSKALAYGLTGFDIISYEDYFESNYDFDSDEESLGYNLDSDEEEETLKSLEEIMALNFNQTPATTGKPPALSKELRSQSSDYTVSTSVIFIFT